MTPQQPRGWHALVAGALLGLSLSAPALARDVELYDQPEFRGVRLTLSAATPDLGAYGVGGRVASVVVKRGQWEFCTQPQFGGACITVGPGRYGQLPPALRGNLNSLRENGGNNNSAAAPRPTPPSERMAAGIILFSGNFNGPQVALRESTPDLRQRSFDDAATTVEVRNGSWDLCQDLDFTGGCVRLGPGRHMLPPAFRSRVTSARPATDVLPVAPVPAPIAAAAAVVLYEHANFGGRQAALQGPEPRLDTAGFNDKATSVVISRGRWQFCEHIDFEGQCLVLGPGRHALSGAFQDSISSLRPVFGADDRPLPAAGGITLHEHADFSGRNLLRTELTLNLAEFGFNDRASSIEVHAGQWELCGDAQFAGRCAVFGPGRHQLPDFLNDRVSSLRSR